ncbi:phosphatidylinositol-specific phospholipase C [Arcanobacterium hippocoleae]
MFKILRKMCAVGAGLIFLLLPTQAFAHYDRAYWHEESAASQFIEQYQDWMITIPDNRRLSDISIPGTHDTMAYSATLPFKDIVRTQTMNLRQQLDSGIRYLDIRLSHEGDVFKIYHGSVYLGVSFNDVLETISQYLTQFPTETILMRVKQEHSRVPDKSMWDLFAKYDQAYPGLFWNRSLNNTDNPTLGQVRGKVVVLSDIWGLSQGISYARLPKQDNYHLTTNWDLYSKWSDVKQEIYRANSDRSGKIHLNHLSGSGGAFPYFVASGHSNPETNASRLSTGYTTPGFRHMYPDFPRTAVFLGIATISFEGTNTLAADYLQQNSISQAGVVIADFPGERLIDAVIQCNYR